MLRKLGRRSPRLDRSRPGCAGRPSRREPAADRGRRQGLEPGLHRDRAARRGTGHQPEQRRGTGTKRCGAIAAARKDGRYGARCCSPPPSPPPATTTSARPRTTCGEQAGRPTTSTPTATTCGPASDPPMSPSTASQSPSNSAMSPRPSGGPSRSTPHSLPADLRERRAQVFIDLGRAYVQRRDDAAATTVFRQAEELAPEEVHYSVPVREALREMLKREHRYATPELRPLARRTGIIS